MTNISLRISLEYQYQGISQKKIPTTLDNNSKGLKYRSGHLLWESKVAITIRIDSMIASYVIVKWGALEEKVQSKYTNVLFQK